MNVLITRIILLLVCITPLIGRSQSFTTGVYDKGSGEQNFRSVGTLSDGNVVACFSTTAVSIGIKMPPGYGFHIDATGTKSVICFSNDLTEVKWALTSIGNDNFEIDELVTDQFDNTYALFTGNISEPFTLNDTTLIEDTAGGQTVIVKINKDGEIVWHRQLKGYTFYEDDKMKIGNDQLHIMLPFVEDIINPFTGDVLPVVGERDYYLAQLSFDNEITGVLHIYSHVGIFSVYNYAISNSGNYSLAVTTPLSFVVNGTTHYTSFPDMVSSSSIYEISNDGSTLHNSIPCYTLGIELLYNADENLIVAGSIGPTPPGPIIGDTSLVTPSSKIFFTELNEEFEMEWLHFFMKETSGSPGELKVRDLKTDCQGNYYLSGRAEHLTKFGDLTFLESATWANNWGDAFITRTNNEGVPTWLGYGGGENFSDKIEEMAIDVAGNVFCAGNYMTECNFGPVVLESSGAGIHTEGMLLRVGGGVPEHPSVSLTAENTDICYGGMIELVFDSVYTDSLIWYPVDMSDSLIFTPDTAGVYNYTLIGLDSAGCRSKQSIEIIVHEPPAVEIIAESDQVCLGDSLILEAGGADTYTWDPIIIVSGEYFEPDSVGEYYFELHGVDTLGCVNMDSFLLKTVDTPILTLNSLTDEYVGLDGSIDITVSGGSPEYVFDWDLDGTGDFNDDEDLIGLAGGIYTVVVKDTNDCQATENYEIMSFVSLKLDSKTAFELFPNPTIDFLQINGTGYYEYALYNISGALLLADYGNEKCQLDVSNLKKGSYLLRIMQNGLTSEYVVIKI